MPQSQLTFEDNSLAQALFGEQGQHLRIIGRSLGVKLQVRGNQVTMNGPEPALVLARRVLNELYELLQANYPVYPQDVQYAVRIIQEKESASATNSRNRQRSRRLPLSIPCL